MANMVCTLYRRTAALPDNRAGLFADFVANLLTHERSRREAVGLEWIGDEMIRVGIGQVAWALGAQTEMPRVDAEAILREQLPEHDPARILSAAASAQIIDYGTSVRFSHQLLQQYFAASVLDALLDAKADPAAIWQPDNWWESTGREETAVLLAGDRHDPEGVARWIAPVQPEFAQELLTQPDFKLDLAQIDATTRTALVEGAISKQAERAPEARAAAYRVLGLMKADNRRGIGVVNGIPDIEWCAVPGGAFLYQAGERRTLPTFYIARYPITAAQFQAFLDAPDGFANPRWWVGMGKYEQQEMQTQGFDYPNHPRETVSWYQAVAFTRWLDAVLSRAGLKSDAALQVRLPTEEEWEKAARGTDGREYPWGGEFDATKCNARGNGFRGTTAVGIYPQGASPCGALDMAGNVFEWCLNKVEQPEVVIVDTSGDRRCLRGGSWGNSADNARASYRSYFGFPDVRNFPGWGFRVCLSSVSFF